MELGTERTAERSSRELGQCDEARDRSDGAPGGRRSLTTAPVPASTDLEPYRHGSVRCVVGRKRGLSLISLTTAPVPASTDLEPYRHRSARCVVRRKRGLSPISYCLALRASAVAALLLQDGAVRWPAAVSRVSGSNRLTRHGFDRAVVKTTDDNRVLGAMAGAKKMLQRA
jgi:hypothetical protein